MGLERNAQGKGFTLIEMLVVLLVLAILMAVALPLYLGALTKSEVQTCRANMWSIAEAEQAYRSRTSSHVYTTVLTDLSGDLGATPTCPSGGTYSVVISTGSGSDVGNNGLPVPVGGVIVKCSAAGHGVYAPGVDNN
jgi:type IV pilus assembly protein PilA